LTKDFQFNCPDINPRETAVLMFQSLGVVAQTNVLQINGGASCSGSCYNSEGNPCGGCAPQQGLPDSIITCGCEVFRLCAKREWLQTRSNELWRSLEPRVSDTSARDQATLKLRFQIPPATARCTLRCHA
jgi:hypothetical protein